MAIRMLFLAGMLLAADCVKASGPYLVDDSAITPAGTGQVEGWLSLANDSTLLNIIPATTLKALPSVEWSVAFNGTRLSGADERSVAVQAKWQLLAEDADSTGFALVGNVAADTNFRGPATASGYAAVTWPAAPWLLLHGNLGWTGTLGSPAESALTWGARAEATLVPDRLALHAETFGTSTTGQGFQVGLRPTNRRGNLDLELIFGRNLSGERNNWATLGFAARF